MERETCSLHSIKGFRLLLARFFLKSENEKEKTVNPTPEAEEKVEENKIEMKEEAEQEEKEKEPTVKEMLGINFLIQTL